MTTKFERYFKRAVLTEAKPMPLDGDAAALESSIENPKDAERLNTEVNNVAVGADQVNADTEKLREMAQNYSNEILSILDRVVAIHNDITGGELAGLGIKIGSNVITGIRADLGKLAQIIGGGVNDAIMKNAQEAEKSKTQNTGV